MSEKIKTPTSRSLKAAELRQQFWGKQPDHRTPGKYQYDDNHDSDNLRLAREYESIQAGSTQKLGETATALSGGGEHPKEALLIADSLEKEKSSDFLADTFAEAQSLTREWSDEEIGGIYEQAQLYGSKLYFDRVLPSKADRLFNNAPDTLGQKYGEDLDALKAKYSKIVSNKDGSPRNNVQNNNMIFWQFDSDECVKRRATGEQVIVDKRIYLNPKRTEAVRIYDELLTRVNAGGLVCRSKILDARYGEKGWLTSSRGDTIVLYGCDENADELLGIVKDIYESNKDAFTGQNVTRMPMRIADGVAVGSEPKGFSGRESLTSHRAQIIDLTIKTLNEKAQAKSIDVDGNIPRRNENFRRAIRKTFEANNVNPDNWAFDLI